MIIIKRISIYIITITFLSFLSCSSKGLLKDDSVSKNNFSILFAGDILMANEITKRLNLKPERLFEKISKDLKSYDLFFANLETPVCDDGDKYEGKPYIFRGLPDHVKQIQDLGLDAVSLANNHIMDFGVEGMEQTIDFLDDLDILYSGAGDDAEDARKPLILKHNSTKIYILSYCERPPEDFYATEKNPGAAFLDVKEIISDIKKIRKDNNIVLVSLHWGIEQTYTPRYYQKKIARAIIDGGADGIIGHHPHWPQGIEVYRNKPIIYSLGNFINGFYNRIEKDNILAAFYYNGSRLKKLEILSVAGKNRHTNFKPYIQKGRKAYYNLLLIKRLSAMLGTNVRIVGNRGVILFR